jgi:hypothetical protein
MLDLEWNQQPEMLIEEYSFGRMVVDGRAYDFDLMICGDEVRDKWWRQEGHRLCLQDLAWIVNKNPPILVIGTGYFGRLQVPEPLVAELGRKGIRVETARTSEAVARINELCAAGEITGGAFHLTC